MTQHVLGIDQGHSETRAAVCDFGGQILGLGKAFGACHTRDGMPAAMQAIETAARAALGQAGLPADQVALFYGGLTGADWPDEYGLLTENVLALGLCPAVTVKNDSIVALRGGTSANYGAIVIAGTGGNCAIRSPQGREFIYHYYHDDELQGGLALARTALNVVYRAATGRAPATLLTRRILDLYGLPDVDALLRADVEHRLPPEVTRGVSRLVFETACEGDQAAAQIIKSFGAGLAELVTAGLLRLDMTRLALEVVLSGSVFKGPGGLLQEVMAAAIHMVAPRARLVNARYEPVVGAVLLALEALGVQITEPVQERIEHSSQKFGLIRTLA